MSKRAIVILYEGNEPNEHAVAALAEILRDFHVICDYEDCEIKTIDSEDLYEKFNKIYKKTRPASEVAIENALIYIRERFKCDINRPELATFTINLTNTVVMWSVRLDNHIIDLSDGKSELINAIKILGKANPSSKVVKAMLEKTGVSANVLKVVQAVYNRYFGIDVSR